MIRFTGKVTCIQGERIPKNQTWPWFTFFIFFLMTQSIPAFGPKLISAWNGILVYIFELQKGQLAIAKKQITNWGTNSSKLTLAGLGKSGSGDNPSTLQSGLEDNPSTGWWEWENTCKMHAYFPMEGPVWILETWLPGTGTGTGTLFTCKFSKIAKHLSLAEGYPNA